MRKTVIAVLAVVATVFVAPAAFASEGGEPLPARDWSFGGIFGTFDRASTQRGFQVYSEVCSACHSIRLVAYRNLTEIGFTADEVAAIAAERSVTDGPNDEGDMFERPALPSDRFVSPYRNDQEGRLFNNGALPPDLSLMVKARPGGADYLYGLLTGFEDEAPEGFELADGMSYNHFFPGNQIAMGQPLFDGMVEYADGTEATVDQMAEDLTTFLAWTAEPELEARKNLGVKTLIFLIVLTAMLYAVKRKVWADVH